MGVPGVIQVHSRFSQIDCGETACPDPFVRPRRPLSPPLAPLGRRPSPSPSPSLDHPTSSRPPHHPCAYDYSRCLAPPPVSSAGHRRDAVRAAHEHGGARHAQREQQGSDGGGRWQIGAPRRVTNTDGGQGQRRGQYWRTGRTGFRRPACVALLPPAVRTAALLAAQVHLNEDTLGVGRIAKDVLSETHPSYQAPAAVAASQKA